MDGQSVPDLGDRSPLGLGVNVGSMKAFGLRDLGAE